MKHCPHCNIDYTGCLDRCALCGTPMSGLPSENPFPTLPIQRTNHRVRRILGGITAVILFSFVVLCMMLRLSWAVGLAGSIAITLNYLFVRNVLVHVPDFLRATKRYFLVLMAMALLWFAATGDTNVSTYVIPLVSLTATSFNGVLFGVLQGRLVEGYGKYLLYDALFGGLPLGFMLAGAISQPALAWASVILATVMIALLFALNRHSVMDEARRLFSA